jgi:Ca2+-binding RTX toxin-like protein
MRACAIPRTTEGLSMIITPQPGERLRLPLDTAFTIDLSAILPEGAFVYGFYLNLLETNAGNDNMLDAYVSNENRTITVVPREGWTGVLANGGDPLAVAGEMVFYTNTPEPLTVLLAATPNPRTEPAAAQGGAGRDVILFDAQDADLTRIHLVDTSGGSDRATVTNGAAVMLGRAGDDTLTGWNGNDALYGGGGNDALYGGAGIDRMFGQNGNDQMFGGADNDVVLGGLGNDSVVGGAGNDSLSGGGGQDTLRGEAGDDSIELHHYALDAAMTDQQTLLAYGGDGDDTFQNRNTLTEGRSSVLADSLGEGHAGFVTLHGGAGNDSMYAGTTRGGDLFGGTGNDYMAGSVLEGEEGQMNLYGGEGNDVLYGGNATNLWAGSGDDFMNLLGNTTAWGGDGNDTFNVYAYDTPPGGATVYGGLGADTITLGEGNDTGHGGDGDDVIYGGNGLDMLYGGLGNDTVRGGQGADLLSGGDGADTLAATDDGAYMPGDYEGDLDTKNDTLFGGAGNDALTADRAGHTLYGGSGGDTLHVNLVNTLSGGVTVLDGGLGNDILRSQGQTQATGGADADRFVLELGTNVVHAMAITDFVRGTDVLAVQYNDGDFVVGTNEFVFRTAGNGTDGFLQGARTISWQLEEGGVRVLFDANGDTMSDGSMFVQGATDATFQDFGITVS